ncbi:uncharacterized protein PAC_17727 [Phialocephala subalpina]|uniref:C2H2-type domain-containing protein n=1 Tax=Phialocephala subalpina TaxID=576137 RepID=A0A1L7XS79_9HELO|nr:uncharacterized protein PAC_17727 [Phialocephala subalpina]
MELCQQPTGSERSTSKDSSVSLGFTKPAACGLPIQVKHLRSAPEEVEYDSKSVQLPSLTDGSSRSSSICSEQITSLSRSFSAGSNNIEYNSCGCNYGAWVPEDETGSLSHRTGSPAPLPRSTVSRNLQPSARVPTDTVDLLGLEDCGPQQGSESPEQLSKTACHVHARHASTKAPCQKIVSSSEPTAMECSDIRKSKSIAPHSAIDSESSDSSESEDESDDDDIARDDWSGANDNIEAAIYQSVFPDLKLAAYLISNMYSTIVLSSTKKITRKVSSWQEQITTCATDSGATTSTAKDTSPNISSNTGTGASPKHDRCPSSPDDNIGDDEDDDADEGRRKRLKEKSVDSGSEFPEQRLACPFFKKDALKYSVLSSKHYRVCGGPGWLTIPQLKEHLKRVHYPVQCERCYAIFKFKRGERSSAVSELASHRQQEERCPRLPDSLKEGISDAEWSRLSEEKKNRKGKDATPEKPQSAVDKWKEIWIILFPTIEAPQTPFEVSELVFAAKLSAIKAAHSDEHLKTMLLDSVRKAFQAWGSTFNVAANDTTTDSLSSGSWQRVANSLAPPSHEELSPCTASTHLFPNLNIGTPNQHSAIRTATIPAPSDVNMERTLSPGAAYSMPPVSGNFPFDANLAGRYPQAAYSNSTPSLAGARWSSQMDGLQFDNGFDMSTYQPANHSMPNQWSGQYPATNFPRFGGAP